jgi:hypothetical protein
MCVIICNKEVDETKKTSVQTTVHVVDCYSSDGCGADRKRRVEMKATRGFVDPRRFIEL